MSEEKLTGVLRQCAALYRELIKLHITPAQADDLELWQIASLMEPASSEVASSPAEMNRRIIALRQQAAREGREVDPDEVFNGMSESQIREMTAPRTGPQQ